MREGEDDNEPEQEPQGEKRRHQDRKEETSSDIHYSEDGDRSHETNDIDIEDNEDPRPAKRRKLPRVPTDNALTPPYEYRPKRRLRGPQNLTPPSTSQSEIDKTRSQPDHRHLPTMEYREHHHTGRTSRSRSATVESAPVAEYQEWPLHSFLKSIRIGKETSFNLEFHLADLPEHLELSTPFKASGSSLGIKTAVKSQISHSTVAYSKTRQITLRAPRKHTQ